MQTPTLLLAAVLPTSAASPDEVFLKGGGQLSGKREPDPHVGRLRPLEPETVTYPAVTSGEAPDGSS